jgi:hypothetical protein
VTGARGFIAFEGAWKRGRAERHALLALLPSDPGRAVDLTAVEAVRLAKIGEGDPDRLASALVPSRLDVVLAAGPRGLTRLRHTLAYADKWAKRGDLPASLAPLTSQVRMLPLRHHRLVDAEGQVRDAACLLPEDQTLPGAPRPTLALLGQHGKGPAGWTLACEAAGRVALCPWVVLGSGAGVLEFSIGGHRRRIPADAWSGVSWPEVASGEVLLLPPPRLKPLPALPAMTPLRLRCGPLEMRWVLGVELEHPTAQ